MSAIEKQKASWRELCERIVRRDLISAAPRAAVCAGYRYVPAPPGVFLRYSSERVESMVESAPRQGLSTGSGSALGGLLLF